MSEYFCFDQVGRQGRTIGRTISGFAPVGENPMDGLAITLPGTALSSIRTDVSEGPLLSYIFNTQNNWEIAREYWGFAGPVTDPRISGVR